MKTKKKKYNDDSRRFADWTIAKLKRMYREYITTPNKSLKETLNQVGVHSELRDRGYRLEEPMRWVK